MGFLYTMVDKESESRYPSYANVGYGSGEIHPNVTSFIGAVNKSQPIIKSQCEIVFSRWPRTIFFAKDVTIPGLTTNTIDINHAGFTIPIATHTYYETNEITLNILADKEGYHYYDFRNFVFQSGHPLVAGDPMSTIGNNYNLAGRTTDYIDIKLRNTPQDKVYHHWTVCNFRPTGIGELELGHEDGTFLEFQITGTFTHIEYDCGIGFREVPLQYKPDEEDEKTPEPDKHYNIVHVSSSNLDSSNMDSTQGDGGGEDSTGGGGVDSTGENDSTSHGQTDSTETANPEEEEKKWARSGTTTLNPEIEDIVKDSWEFTDIICVSFVYGYPSRINTTNASATFSPIICASLEHADRERSPREQALARAFMRKAQYETLKLMNGIQNLDGIPLDNSYTPTHMEIPFIRVMAVPIQSQKYPDFDTIRVGGTIDCTIRSERQKQYIQSLVQQVEMNLDDLFLEYSRFKTELVEYEFGESPQDSPDVGKMYVKDELEKIQTLANAIRYNHDISHAQKIDMTVDQKWELENYGLKITQLTLPHRFGMYREQMRGVPVKTFTKLEEPQEQELDYREPDLKSPDDQVSKTRRIFV